MNDPVLDKQSAVSPVEQSTRLSIRQRRLNQLKLLVLWLVPVGLMAIAGLYYYLVQTGQVTIGSKNNGVLMQPPAQLKELLGDNNSLQLIDESGKTAAIWDRKWSMVIRGERQCDEACREVLHLTRQIHIRLDAQASRVQRVYLYDANANTLGNGVLSGLELPFTAYLDQEHRLLKTAAVSGVQLKRLDELLIAANGVPAPFFIVDPQGWAMMYYTGEHQGNDVLKDLKHLLKYSRER